MYKTCKKSELYCSSKKSVELLSYFYIDVHDFGLYRFNKHVPVLLLACTPNSRCFILFIWMKNIMFEIEKLKI